MTFPPSSSSRILTSAFASLLLCLNMACSSNKSDTASVDTRSTQGEFERRIQNVKHDQNRRSKFESTVKSVKTDKQFNTGSTFRTTDYRNGKKQKFTSGKKDIKSKSFSQADKSARDGQSTFRDSNREARDANQSFATRSSSYDQQRSRDSGATFRDSDDVFRTREDPVASKAMSTSKRPYIEESSRPGYTEDEVKAILRKD